MTRKILPAATSALFLVVAAYFALQAVFFGLLDRWWLAAAIYSADAVAFLAATMLLFQLFRARPLSRGVLGLCMLGGTLAAALTLWENWGHSRENVWEGAAVVVGLAVWLLADWKLRKSRLSKGRDGRAI